MTRTELINNVAAELGCGKSEAANYVDAVFGQLTAGLKEDQKVNITGFGVFEVRHHKEHKGINPSNKQEMTIPASNSVGFRASQKLKDEMN